MRPFEVVDWSLFNVVGVDLYRNSKVVSQATRRQESPQTEFDPDLVVVRMDQIGGAKFTEPPLLVLEIRSPSTALIDLNRKKAAYERFGVRSYWIVNPGPSQPELTVFELRDGCYDLAAETSVPFTVDRPFTVTIAPARLTSGLRH